MKALRSVVVGLVLRNVLLEVRAVVRDETTLGAAELSFWSLRGWSAEVQDAILFPLLCVGSCSVRHQLLQVNRYTANMTPGTCSVSICAHHIKLDLTYLPRSRFGVLV